MTDETLTTWVGRPTQPHEVPFPEAMGWSCGECGQVVETDDGEYWWHTDERFNPKGADDD